MSSAIGIPTENLRIRRAESPTPNELTSYPRRLIMASIDAGRAISRTGTQVAAFGFVPVAVHFRLFELLTELDKPSNAGEVLAACTRSIEEGDAQTPVPCLLLIQDTLTAMTALSFVDMPINDVYAANSVTRYLATVPSARHGALHMTTEVILAAAFLMRKLQADNFRYPFQECDTPFQYAYRQMGRDDLADQHTYTIMAEQGRLDSFNQFMTGKYCKTRSESDRIKSLGYDLEAVLNERNPELVTMVDIGGSRGELLLDLKTTFPQLTRAELVVQEYNPDINDIPELTLMSWDYKAENSPQPIQGALIYHLSHVLHNLSDNEAVRLLQKVADAMESQSRLLIHEVVRTALTASLHCVMSVLFGGRERIRDDWHRLASEAGLKVTFEAYPSFGDGLIEMRRV